VAGRAGKLEILPIIEKKLFQNRNREMEKGNDNTPGGEGNWIRCQRGEMQFCMFHWMVKEKKRNGRATIITVSSAIDSCTGINFSY